MKKLLKSFSTIVLSMSLLFTTVLPSLASDISFSNTSNNYITAKTVKVSKVILNKKTTSISIGSFETLIPTITPTTATNQAVTWKSSNKSIVTVDNLGVIKGIKKGKATITVTTVDGKKTAKCIVSVTIDPLAIKVSGIKLNTLLCNINVGSNETIIAIIFPSNASNKEVVWKSSKPSVATVDSNGIVNGLRVGETIITATTTDGNKTVQCKIIVNNGMIKFKSPNLENAIREMISKPTGILVKNDVVDIEFLDASSLGIDDLSGIENLTGLVDLDLSDNKINDIGELNGLVKLINLDLSKNKIEDVIGLKGLVNLVELNLENNKISEDDVSELNKFLPNCKIVW